jgi:hypothetical protein
MTRKTYNHSAYWYAYHNGWTYSEAQTYVGRYLDLHTYRARTRERLKGEWSEKDWFKRQNAPIELDSTFNPLLLCALAMVDIGLAVRNNVQKFADPVERDRMKRELVRDLRAFRRPFYYARETERRRTLALMRRKIVRRTVAAPMPTPEELLDAWNRRKESKEAMIHLGGLLDNLACYVDSCLKIDEYGNIVGRNSGIKGWLNECLPQLSPKYKTLMRYKALATRLRQATETKDPTPTSKLLKEPRSEIVTTLLADPKPVFSQLFNDVDRLISAEHVFLDAPKKIPLKPRSANRLSSEKRRERQRE